MNHRKTQPQELLTRLLAHVSKRDSDQRSKGKTYILSILGNWSYPKCLTKVRESRVYDFHLWTVWLKYILVKDSGNRSFNAKKNK